MRAGVGGSFRGEPEAERKLKLIPIHVQLAIEYFFCGVKCTLIRIIIDYRYLSIFYKFLECRIFSLVDKTYPPTYNNIDMMHFRYLSILYKFLECSIFSLVD